MTRAPSPANASAVARPSPREPATTRAALPCDSEIHPRVLLGVDTTSA